MKGKVLAINTGSTSTKVGYYVDGKPVFVKTGTDTANFGDDEARYIFAAQDECPNDCIEEIG